MDIPIKHANQSPYLEWIRAAHTVLYFPLLLRHITSAADFGCNCGAWLYALKEKGINDVIGVNIGAPRTNLLFSRNKYKNHDLAMPLDLGRRFDLVIGLEVAEHIPAEGADNYVDTLTRHGDFILFSAAIPGQAGDGHINCQPHEYWHQKFLSRGYAKLDVIRPAIRGDWRVQSWYQSNVFLYIKPRYEKEFAVYA
jgi:hypothetical protein